jgi:hypothetical protein
MSLNEKERKRRWNETTYKRVFRLISFGMAIRISNISKTEKVWMRERERERVMEGSRVRNLCIFLSGGKTKGSSK